MAHLCSLYVWKWIRSCQTKKLTYLHGSYTYAWMLIQPREGANQHRPSCPVFSQLFVTSSYRCFKLFPDLYMTSPQKVPPFLKCLPLVLWSCLAWTIGYTALLLCVFKKCGEIWAKQTQSEWTEGPSLIHIQCWAVSKWAFRCWTPWRYTSLASACTATQQLLQRL